MKTMLWPSAASRRRTTKISSVSCGVSTAVGSSRTRIFASRYSALRISTRCCQPTDSDPTFASGSTSNPNRRPRSTIRRWASFRSRKNGLAIVSSPRTMFSATVSTGTSMKCWWTMLMPRAIASDGPVRWTSAPSSRICALVRACQPVEDVHEGGLARAVLAEEGVDLAGPDVEVDAVVGDDPRIALRDAAHLERGRLDRLGHRGHGPLRGEARSSGGEERAGRDGRPA